MSEALVVDGSLGEGGGQVLRQALALAMITGRAIEIDQICASRTKPGLMRRHLAVIRAAAQICDAEVEGDTVGSQTLRFSPGEVKAGEYTFSVGTGKSAVKVLQTLLPPLMIAGGVSTLRVVGSTHAPNAPSFESLARTWIPVLMQMGPHIEVELEKHGFYPAGGGCIKVKVEPSAGALAPLRVSERGALLSKRALALVAHLDDKIGQRELDTLDQMMTWGEGELGLQSLDTSAGPGNAVLIEVASEHITEIFTGVGERSIRAEVVAEHAAAEAREYMSAEVPISRHTADQLIIPLSMAGEGTFCTTALSRHTQGAIELVRQFTDLEVAVANIRGQWHVEI